MFCLVLIILGRIGLYYGTFSILLLGFNKKYSIFYDVDVCNKKGEYLRPKNFLRS